MATPHPDLKTLFLEALEHPEGTDRAAYLDGACRGDASLRAALEGLLEAHARAGEFLAPAAGAAETAAEDDSTLAEADHPAPTDPTAAVDDGAAAVSWPRPIAEEPGSRIGPYRLIERLGEGGMGAVFLAEQDRPVRRRVALKVIKPGMDTELVVRRFEAERQALALMDHPNIARVFDAGSTDSGRPFFVMELVDGVPINEYCDRERLGLRHRLELFATVCRAIQHAHQKGIIHRDIKPSNVLVTVQDGRPVPMVIDFGVAKAIDRRLTERTLFTQLGALVGTPEYMSPEQADVCGEGGIDTRSDIYSLGVLLYELLTGATPLGRVRLREAAFSEVLRRIREEEPPRPSTRISGSGEALASIAACRGIEPARLAKLVRGDLDRVTMKALEKDRSRRYATATELERDVRRYLDGDPVEAGPPSLIYRAGKYARKHRAAFAFAAASLLMLVGASVVSTGLMLRARSAERLAEGRLDGLRKAHAETTVALEQARRAQARSRTEADKATAVNDFLTKDLLSQAEPANNAVANHVELLDVLDRAAERVGERFAGRPEVEDSLRRTIAGTYHGLGAWEKAERQWRAVLDSSRRRQGPGSPEALTAQGELAHLLRHRGRVDAGAIGMAREASEGLARSLGPDHPDALAGRRSLALVLREAGRSDEAIRMLEEVVEGQRRALGPDHPDTLQSRHDLANAYRQADRLAEATALHGDTVKRRESRLGPDHPGTIASRVGLAIDDLAAGRPAEAIALLEPALRAMESRLGPGHVDTLMVRETLGEAYRAAGRPAEAIALLEPAARQVAARSGPDHPFTLIARMHLGRAYLTGGHPAEAIAVLEPALERLEATLGPDHVDTLAGLGNLAWAYDQARRPADAIRLLEPALGLMEAKLGPDHGVTLNARDRLAFCYRVVGRPGDAARLLEPELERREARFGAGHRHLLDVVRLLAGVRVAQGRPAEAEPLFRRAIDGYCKREGPDGPMVLELTRDLALLLCRSGRLGEAEPLLREVIARRRAKLPAADPSLAELLDPLGLVLVRQEKWADAEAVLRECLTIRQRARPDDWATFDTRSQLGGCLLARRAPAEAEPLIVAGYEGMAARASGIPPSYRGRLELAARRVVELYEVWGRPREAAVWRARVGLAELPADVFAP